MKLPSGFKLDVKLPPGFELDEELEEEEKELDDKEWLADNRKNIPSSLKVMVNINGKRVEVSANVILKQTEKKIETHGNVMGCLE